MDTRQAPLPPDLYDAYLKTTYQASTDIGEIEIRIGDHQPNLDVLLDRASAVSWAFITAFNPRSAPLSQVENSARQAELRCDVVAAGYCVYDAVGRPDSGDWPPEDSLLLLGITRAKAIALARRFHQNAIVFGYRHEVARLINCLPES